MTATLSDPVTHILAGTFALVGLLALALGKRGLRGFRDDLRARGFSGAIQSRTADLVMFALASLLILCVMWTLVVGTHKSFHAVLSDDSGLTLRYLWPRTDVRLRWADLTDAAVEKRQFRLRVMHRLRVTTVAETFFSPWTGHEEVLRAQVLVSTHNGPGSNK